MRDRIGSATNAGSVTNPRSRDRQSLVAGRVSQRSHDPRTAAVLTNKLLSITLSAPIKACVLLMAMSASILSFFCHSTVSRFSRGSILLFIGWEGISRVSSCFVSNYENSL